MIKKISAFIVILVTVFFSCRDGVENLSEFTGNEMVYSLYSGSSHGLSGTVTFREKRDRTTLVTVALDESEKGMRFPVHLHLGGIAKPGADIAAILSPVASGTGLSVTTISHLSDETRVTYEDMLRLEACVKVHLSDVGAARDILLAGGNVGRLAVGTMRGREVFGICKSE